MILHLSTEMSMGGGERQLLYLYRGLHEKTDFSQRIICASNSALEKYCQQHHYAHIALKRRGSFSLSYAWALKKTLVHLSCHHPIRIVHCHDAHAHTHAVLADILGRITGGKYPMPLLIIHKKVIPTAHRKSLKNLKYRYSRIHKIIAVSEATATICREWTKPTKDKVVVLYDTLQCADYYPPQPHATLTIGIIGSLIPVKNHAFFLQCVHLFMLRSAQMPCFWIIGDGPLRDALQTQANTLGIASAIQFLGFREDIPALLSQMDILLVTSTNEGLCSTILQAMAAQVPVIACPVGGIPELIQHNHNGLLADSPEGFVNLILALQADPLLKKHITDTALREVQGYDLPIYIEKMLHLYPANIISPRKISSSVSR